MNSVSPDSIEHRSLEIAREISANGPLAVSQLLETLRYDDALIRGALEREALCQSANYASQEFKEGIAAVREKRAPKFR